MMYENFIFIFMHYGVWCVFNIVCDQEYQCQFKVFYIGMIVFTYNTGKALYAKQVLKKKEKEI